jgi:pimeloyl-ACP methyl ester carboxylesterase
MKFIVNNNNNKATVVFIHGFKKNYNDWNTTEFGKEINIEKNIRKICNTILIQLELDDYKLQIMDVVNDIYNQLQTFINTKITLVSHSNGSFYCIALGTKYPKIFSRIIMLDPTIKSDNYLSYLKTNSQDNPDIVSQQIKNFDQLPTLSNVPLQVIVRIHINMKPDQTMENSISFVNKIKCLDGLIKKNMKSRLCLHVDVSHMIHYKIPHVVIDSIKEVYKL